MGKTTSATIRQRLWNAELKRLVGIKDNEGVAIDREILETVAAFNMNGFPTLNSCAGHVQKGKLRFPHVLGAAPGQPASRFGNDAALRKTIARKHHIGARSLEFNNDAAQEYYAKVRIRGLRENVRYCTWKRANRAMDKKLQALLDRFYANRNVSQASRLSLARPTLGYLLTAGTKQTKQMLKHDTVPQRQIPKVTHSICAAQNEMRDFTRFLKQRFFKGESR